MATHANRVQMTVTGTPGTGTITLNAASSGYQTFGSAHGANATVDCLFTDGTAWEVARDCTYTHSGTTLSRGTLEASSTGSAISLTSAAVVSQILTADSGRRWDAAALEHSTVTGTSGAITAAVNTIYIADMSGWTADRTLTLPATAAIGDRVGMMVSTGDDAYEWLVTAATGDTLDGVSGGTEWSRLFMTGECVIFRCITANSTWVVEHDGRKFETFRVITDGTTASHATGATKVSSELATVSYDTDAIWSTTNKRFLPRRKGKYLVHGHVQMASVGSGLAFVAQLYLGGVTNIAGGPTTTSSASVTYPECDVAAVYQISTVGDYIELFIYNQDVSRNTNSDNVYFEGTRIP